jgi:hypothetical protein
MATEASALEVERGKVEPIDVQFLAVDDQEFAVIARQVVGGPAHGDTGVEHPQLELPQAFLAARVRMRDQGPHLDAPLDGRLNRPLQGLHIEPEDDDVERALCLLDGAKDGLEPVGRLHDEFHASNPPASPRPRAWVLNLRPCPVIVTANCWPFA